MNGDTAVSLGLFGIVWALLCVVAGVVVLDAMLRRSKAGQDEHTAASENHSSRRPTAPSELRL